MPISLPAKIDHQGKRVVCAGLTGFSKSETSARASTSTGCFRSTSLCSRKREPALRWRHSSCGRVLARASKGRARVAARSTMTTCGVCAWATGMSKTAASNGVKKCLGKLGMSDPRIFIHRLSYENVRCSRILRRQEDSFDPVRSGRGDFFLPDRDGFLEGVDEIFAGGEGFFAMAGGDGDDDADFSSRHGAEAMEHNDALDGP